MGTKFNITMQMTMDVILSSNANLIRVLQDNNMQCIGCPLAAFHNVRDAAHEHALDANDLLKQLQHINIFDNE